MHVLLIEHQSLDQSQSLRQSLEQHGHQVNIAHTPATAATQTSGCWPNLIVFNMAGGVLSFADFQQAIDGTRLNIPRLVVGNPNELNSNIGKTALVVSTESVKHLNQSIQKATAPQKGRFLRYPGLVIDLDQRRILRNEQQFSLTPKEFKLLQLLIESSNQILSRKTIMQQVWETDYMGDTRTLDVHIRWLREKIEENPGRPERLVTVRGVGYRFVAPTTPAD